METFEIASLDLAPFMLSFKLAGMTTLILFVIALPMAWFLSQSNSKTKPVLEAVTALPIVLPPSVLGFYILVALSPNSAVGGFFEDIFGVKLVFSFTGLVVASCFYSLPFMVQPLQSGFESLNRHMIEASYLAGKSKLQTMIKVALPNIKPSLITAIIITFAHTVGEFGVVTKVASVAIYEMVEVMEYGTAHIYSAIMVLMSFLVLLSVYVFNHQQKKIGILK